MIGTRGRRAHRGRRGIALVYAIFGVFVAAAMVGVMFAMAGVTRTRAETQRLGMQAQYLAEGAVEAAKKGLQDAIANWEEPADGGSIEIDGYRVPFTVEATGPPMVVTDSAGIQTIHRGYEVETVAVVDGIQGRAHRIVDVESTPIFQFAVFYANDLEVQPGEDMTLGGRVHTNGDMYLGSTKTLTLNTNHVRTLGKVYRRRKDTSDSNGTVVVRKWVENPFDAAEPAEYVKMAGKSDLSPVDSVSGYDSDFEGWDDNGDGDYDDLGDWLPFAPGALDLWGAPDGYGQEGYTVLTGDHGVTEAVTPNIGSISMFDEVEGGSYEYDVATKEYVFVGAGAGTHDKGFFHQNAGLSIVVDADGSGFTVYDGDGAEIPAVDLGGAVWLEGILDARQSDSKPKRTPAVRVDLALLKAAGIWPDNGLLYAAHYGMGTGLDAKGVVLQNGSELAGDLTVVSEGSIYVKGDYNVTDKKSAAVISDAVNLLSNSWDDSKVAGGLPPAIDTTYNTAIITGNYATTDGSYNGGLENLPRFHESWSGKKCVIDGSFVCAWESQYATGGWKYGGDRYQAPVRYWSYDPLYNNVANLPPFTPMAVTASDVVAW